MTSPFHQVFLVSVGIILMQWYTVKGAVRAMMQPISLAA